MGENFPEGKFMATVRIGTKGQIVIPKEARALFGLKSGDSLILMADRGQGIALQPFSYAESFWNAISNLQGGDKKE